MFRCLCDILVWMSINCWKKWFLHENLQGVLNMSSIHPVFIIYSWKYFLISLVFNKMRYKRTKIMSVSDLMTASWGQPWIPRTWHVWLIRNTKGSVELAHSFSECFTFWKNKNISSQKVECPCLDYLTVTLFLLMSMMNIEYKQCIIPWS